MAFGLGVAKGMLTTISHLVKAPITIQYPEERLEMPIWTRGRPRPPPGPAPHARLPPVQLLPHAPPPVQAPPHARPPASLRRPPPPARVLWPGKPREPPRRPRVSQAPAPRWQSRRPRHRQPC